ncbi:MAG: ABC transporter ATP-binding protein [Bacillota bacterium]|jgi:putative ABC transport system ATP-binding protein|nr:ABC transporter ATP-binding protein [Bacillota bacterium]HOB92411.1 ABC transporter ATP-binding protein [Bacillota bacterium]HPZ55569.1 ABC transporter ATP-binding protein [Bacillota bacterium]HQD19119.1 ABC transporter ATP-binding protein [Bacillota bacterium]
MIRLEDVTKIYTMGEVDVVALNGVSLEIQRGEFVSVMGPSGSGKSTLLHILGALDTPTSGRYYLEDVDIADLDDAEMSRIRNRHFGFVFQSYNLFNELNALENVMMPMVYARVPKRERIERAKALLSSVNMDHRMKHYPNQLSGGEQQRVAIARALANNPTLLLADEPTGNLSSVQGGEILDILCNLNDEGTTVVMVTHDLKVGSYARRLIALRDGQVAADQPVPERFTPLPSTILEGRSA